MELNMLNLPVFKAAVDVFAQSLEDERIPPEVREEYRGRYISAVDLAKETNDFDKEFSEVSDRIKGQRERMDCKPRRLIGHDR
ncbi:hypothetical protein [Paenibacillus sp. IHBB 3054]|uniref:hypothetical protein n=1 Tax=Paenibacillus sp. IHBB 3054 TaxID=3425689 RepID=UPI003F670AF1